MKPAIEVQNISKSYRISHQSNGSYKTLKDSFGQALKKPLGRSQNKETEIFWALKDIDFQVQEGEAFGIIGKNGSGKSTLLKILSRIVEPTSGNAILRGRVASLLEVGTGFHPELTGRENIYFNGSMLGMSRQEIKNKFNEIVDFSEIEQFIDTPVKFYSSGMYVRLAFSVAAHLDPEILILDEVLSVGDVQFQNKSMNKMRSIAKSGRTILYVSHSMTSVEELCSRALLLNKGKIQMIDDSTAVAERYISDNLPKEQAEEENNIIRISEEEKRRRRELNKKFVNFRKTRGIYIRGEENAQLLSAKLINKRGTTSTRYAYGDPLKIKLETNRLKNDKDYALEIRLKNSNSENIAFSSSLIDNSSLFKPGDGVEITIPSLNLLEGFYIIDLICRAPGEYHVDNWWDTIIFEVSKSMPGEYPVALKQSDDLGSYILTGVEYNRAQPSL